MHDTSSKYGSPSDHSSRWCLVEHSSSILNAPTFCIYVQKILPTETSDLKPLWMIWWWTHLPSSRAAKLAHAFSTPTKETEPVRTLSGCICPNSSSAFCPWLHFTCPNTMAFQVTTSWDGILLNTLSILHAATFCIHIHQATPHKDIELTTILNDLLVNIHAVFKFYSLHRWCPIFQFADDFQVKIFRQRNQPHVLWEESSGQTHREE